MADLITVQIHGSAELICIDSPKSLIEIWIAGCEFLQGAFKELRDVLKSLMLEAVLIKVRKLFPDAEIAGTNYWSGGRKRFGNRRRRRYGNRIYMHRLESDFDCSDDIQKRFIDVRPSLDCLAVLRYGLKLSEREFVPVAGTAESPGLLALLHSCASPWPASFPDRSNSPKR